MSDYGKQSNTLDPGQIARSVYDKLKKAIRVEDVRVDRQQVRWRSNTEFEAGTVDSNTEISGSGNDAIVSVKSLSDNSDDYDFSTSADYTYNSTNIEVTGGKAKLKASTGDTNDWPYSTSADYTYDSAKIEVDSGEASLILALPSDGMCWANYDTDEDLNLSLGSATGTLGGGATVSGGFLDCRGGGECVYDGVSNADFDQQGTVRFKVKPNYSGSPASGVRYFGSIRKSGSNESKIDFYHRAINGNISMECYDNNGVFKGTVDFGVWSPSAGTEYEIEYNLDFDISSGHEVFVDGVLLGTQTKTYTRDSADIDELVVGLQDGIYAADAEFNQIMVFDAVQHTSNYTATDDWVFYDTNNPTIVTDNGWAYSAVLDTFTETSTKTGSDEITYNLSDDDGTTFKYWSGAAWVSGDGTYTQSNSASVVHTNIGSFPSSGTLKVKAFLHSDDGTTTPSLSNIFVATAVVYPTGDHEIEANDDIEPASMVQWLVVTETVTKPTNTNILYKHSEDSGSTYNATWLTAAQLQTELQAISSPVKTRIKWQLSTTDTSVTPEADNLNITSSQGFATSGTYTSNVYDSTYLELKWREAIFSITEPSDTSITISARAADTTTELSAATYTELTDETVTGLEGRYFQWKADFTGLATERSTLDSFKVQFSVGEYTVIAGG